MSNAVWRPPLPANRFSLRDCRLRLCRPWLARLATGVSLLAFNSTIFAACSPYAGTVVFNEVQDAGASTYLELRVMNPAITAATNTFANWKIGVYTSASTTPSFVADFKSIVTNASLNNCGAGSPWIKVPDSAINNSLVAARTATMSCTTVRPRKLLMFCVSCRRKVTFIRPEPAMPVVRRSMAT
jgi:hypothetical protein